MRTRHVNSNYYPKFKSVLVFDEPGLPPEKNVIQNMYIRGDFPVAGTLGREFYASYLYNKCKALADNMCSYIVPVRY